MKATKKIVGAACALVAAVALSAGSTFAWFSTNGKVTATGMKVTAMVPTDLNIKEGLVYDTTLITESTVTFTPADPLTALMPAKLTLDTAKENIMVQVPNEWTSKPTSATPGTPKSYKNIMSEEEATTAADGASEDDADPSTYYTNMGKVTNGSDHFFDPTSTAVDAVSKQYVSVYTMSLVNKGAEDGKINLQAIVDVSWEATDTSHQFVWCGFAITQSDDADAAGSATYTDIKAPSAGQELAAGGTSGQWTIDLLELENNKAYQVQFFVYFNGDSDNCYTENALKLSALDVSITYQQKAATGTGD